MLLSFDLLPQTTPPRLSHVNNLNYKNQAIWFLNAFWSKGPNFGANPALREEVWECHKTCVKLDKAKGESGNELSEFDAHRLIEILDAALTVQRMREVLKEIDVDFNKKVSLTEFMIYKFAIDWKVLVNAPQSCDMTAINMAQAGLDNANAMLQRAIEASKVAQDDALKSKVAEADAKEEEEKSTAAAAKARVAEAELKEATDQAAAALADLKAQEDSYKSKCEVLETAGNDEASTTVKRGKAKAELAQLKAEDPMPLRKAKIQQEAAVRKLQKATIKAGAAAAAAEQAAKHAAESRKKAQEAAIEALAAAKAADEAIPLAEQAFQDAEQVLQEVKAKNSGSGEGQIYYIDRELEEAKKFLPKSKLAAAQAAAEQAKAMASPKK